MKLTYRPEIDGLRAIAVVAVILYHAQITILGHQPFKGGFIGVDIFFVISGYLITSIILKELITTGSFSFKHFYERRIRRILPAYLLVMLVSLFLAWMYLLPSSFIDFSKSVLYSLGFSSNFYFHYSGQQYGAESGLLKPFLHTWSLSVEEQYYILFPIVLIISFKYFRKYLIHILILSFFFSLGLADWVSKNFPSVSFYFLHTRIWEILAGSILAYFEITLGCRSKNKIFNHVFPSVGVLLILINIFFFKLYFPHPSLHTLPAIIGVCLIIWFSQKGDFVNKLFSSKLLVGIGLISYSLYLWHYPIFVFSNITDFSKNSIFKEILIGLIILILSIFSYYFIERPFRNKKNKFKIISAVIIISVTILVFLNSNTIIKEGYKNRVPGILQSNLSEQPWELLKNSDDKICFDNLEGCKFNTSSKRKVFIIGDSHMASIMSNLKDKIVKKNYQFITSTYRGCIFYPGFDGIETKTLKKNKYCNDNYFKKLKEILLKEKDSIIIFGGRFSLHFNDYYFFDNEEGGIEKGSKQQWRNKFVSVGKYNTIQSSFKNEVLKLSNNNNIILIYPIPEVGWNPNKKINSQWINRKNKFYENFNLENVTTSYQVYKNRSKSSFELLDSIQGDNIHRVYPHKLFCDTIIKERCVTHDVENIYYTDAHHPSVYGSELINRLIIKKIKEIKNN